MEPITLNGNTVEGQEKGKMDQERELNWQNLMKACQGYISKRHPYAEDLVQQMTGRIVVNNEIVQGRVFSSVSIDVQNVIPADLPVLIDSIVRAVRSTDEVNTVTFKSMVDGKPLGVQ